MRISPDIGELYADHAKRVRRWVLRFFPPDDGDEIVHEVFVKVLERRHGFREHASPLTWIYRITVNHCLNRLRDEGRRAELWREHSPTWSMPIAPADQDTMTFLRQFWRSLDDELVCIGFHFFVDGMTHAEIARVMGCAPRTIGLRLERLRELALRVAGRKAPELRSGATSPAPLGPNLGDISS